MIKRLGLILGFMVCAVFLFSGVASADPVTITLTGVSGGSQGGVYTDPYYATVNGVTNVVIACDDFYHDVYIGETWTATVSTFSDLSNVEFQEGANTLKDYEEAGWLYDQLFVPANAGETGDISFAMWAIFDPSVKSDSGWDTGAASWLMLAEEQTFAAGEFSNLEILTPTNPGPDAPQEYITSTPEPGSLALFGLGLIGLGVAMRARKSRCGKNRVICGTN